MKTKKPYKPRTIVPFNTGTRAHRSEKTYRRVKRPSLDDMLPRWSSAETGAWQGGNTEWPAIDRE
jgi:hypothetical protein